MTNPIEINFFNLTQDFIKDLRETLKPYNTYYFEEKVIVKNADNNLIELLESWDMRITYV
jgi:hypothetical protein